MHTHQIPRMEYKNAPVLPPELKAALDNVTGGFEKAVKSLENRLDEVEKKASRPFRGGGGPSSSPEGLEAERKALATFVRTGDDSEMKSLSVGTDPAGGYTVHAARSTDMTKKIFDESPLRGLCRTVTITEGDAFEEPVDISEAGANWVGENSSRPETTNPSLRMLRIPVHEIYALVPVTQRLLDDSGMDIGAWVDGKIAEKFARSEGLAGVNGDGVTKPRGFMTYDAVATSDATRPWGKLQYVPSGSAGAASDADGQANGIKDLYWSLRAGHRKEATWYMASSTANAIDKLKDNNKDYIWRDGMTAGAPPSLLGRPVEFDENMPAIDADAFPIAFGDFKRGYTMVDKVGIRYLRDPFSSKPHVVFYAYRRTGGDVNNFEAIKLLKIATS